MTTFIGEFLKTAEKYPDHIAVDDKSNAYTYRELAGRSAAVAEKLVEAAGEPESSFVLCRGRHPRVGVLVPRSVDYLVAMLGVLRAGCVLVPIDTKYPAARIAELFRDAGCRLLLTTRALWREKALADGLRLDGPQVLFLEELPIAAEESLNLSKPDDEAVIFYTSGSTGRPKGVVHSERILLASCVPLETHYAVTDTDHGCLVAGVMFIASFSVMLSLLKHGGAVYIADDTERLNPRLLYQVICRKRITVMFMVPKLFSLLCRLYGELPLRCVLLSGERLTGLPPEAGKVKVIGVYGATETGGVIAGEMIGDAGVLLGRPVSDNTVYLLDDNGNLVTAPGEVGEACVSNRHLALFYNNLPEETAAHFTANPFAAGERLFRTGDYMSWLPGGELQFHGRRDELVKLNGYRVELGEIEAVCRKTAGVREAACALKRGHGGDCLCLYYVAAEGAAVTAAELRAQAAKYLPEYMVPEVYCPLPVLPLNDNGKLDRKALPDIEMVGDKKKRQPPANSDEREICDVFAKVLGLSPASIGADDDFIRLGGNSLSAMRLIAELDRPELGAMDILRVRTPQKLAQLLREKAARPMAEDLDTLEAAGRGQCHSLTDLQEYILETQLNDLQSTMWILWERKRFENTLDANRLCRAIELAVKNHPALSVVFRKSEAGGYEFFYDKAARLSVTVESVAEDEARRLVQEAPSAFEVLSAPLCRFRVLRSEKYTYLFWEIHHLLLDGRSIGILVRDIEQAYYGRELPKDYSFAWLVRRERRQRSDDYRAAREYFVKAYGNTEWCCGLPSLDDTAGESLAGLSAELELEAGAIERAERNSGFTRNCIALLAGLLALAECTGKREVFLVWLYDNRTSGYLKNSIGHLLQEFPVALRLAGSWDKAELLAEIDRQIQDGIKNSLFGIFSREGQELIKLTDEPVTINYLQAVGDWEWLGEYKPVRLAGDQDHGIFDITIKEQGRYVRTALWYPAEQYSREQVEEFLQAGNKHFAELVGSFLSDG